MLAQSHWESQQSPWRWEAVRRQLRTLDFHTFSGQLQRSSPETELQPTCQLGAHLSGWTTLSCALDCPSLPPQCSTFWSATCLYFSALFHLLLYIGVPGRALAISLLGLSPGRE